jgi:hypothetical protein
MTLLFICFDFTWPCSRIPINSINIKFVQRGFIDALAFEGRIPCVVLDYEPNLETQ